MTTLIHGFSRGDIDSDALQASQLDLAGNRYSAQRGATPLILSCNQYSYTNQYWVGLGIYNVFFHALARFPGPKLWTAYRLPFVISMINGNLTHQTKHFHEKYGSIVRTAPDELSFTNDAAWRDIHAYRAGHQNFPKSQLWNTIPNLGKRGPPKKSDHILNANDADHSRIRKLFSHSFSEKAVTEQEPLVQSYVDLLIAQLRKQVELNKGSAINISTWYSFTTFDIIGDLGFGEPFDCLKEAKYHAWVGMLVGQFKAATVGLAMQYYPLGRWFMQNLIPQKIIDDVVKHAQFTDEKVRHRLSLEVDRPDFLSGVLRHNDEKGMTVEEIVETSNIMLVAGSETTALTLSGITSYLVKNSDVMTKLVEEVRHTFKTDSDIKPGQVSKLPYLNAVIQEGFRLCPPIPDGFRREVPLGGDTICGEWIPEGVSICLIRRGRRDSYIEGGSTNLCPFHLRQSSNSAHGQLTSPHRTSPDLPSSCQSAGSQRPLQRHLNLPTTTCKLFIPSRSELAIVLARISLGWNCA